MTDIKRCSWPGTDPLYVDYHDTEWGVPCFNDTKLFEFLLLEGAQAGLSWITVLRKREGYRKAFSNFDAEKIARFSPVKLERLRNDSSIIRNRLKIQSAVINAQSFLKVQEEHDGFANYLWQFVNGEPMQNRWKTLADTPTSTPQSDAMSKDLKKRGFKFVGTTICYAYMQAMGMVNDHTIDCFRHEQCSNKNGRQVS